MKKIFKSFYFFITSVVVLTVVISSCVYAQSSQNDNRDFSIQVSPSPIVETVQPGVRKTTELKIRNNGGQAETLKVSLRSFKVDDNTGEINLTDETPTDVKDWVSFKEDRFTVQRGETYVQNVIFDTPSSAGFSYYFAILIQQAEAPTPSPGKPSIQGSVAVFTLLSVDRPGAVRKFKILELSSKKRIYEYLPASFDLKVKNDGNTLVRPVGNVFIQRSSKNSNPLAVLPANKNESFLLPGVTRTLNIEWEEGFPVYKFTKPTDDSDPKRKLSWNWNKASNFRIGKYVAKVVAIYDDGQRQIPVEAEVNFWVIPWKILIGLLIIILIIAYGLINIIKGTLKIRGLKIRRRKTAKSAKENRREKPEDDSDNKQD